MELRRPTLADKETILNMMAEFEETQSAHDGGFWDAENFVYEEWLESNQNHEMGINLPEGWVPDIQLVAFSRDGQAVGFLNLRLRLNNYLLNEGGHIGYSIRPSERGKDWEKEHPSPSRSAGGQFEDVRKRTSIVSKDLMAKRKSIHRAVILAENGQSSEALICEDGIAC